MINSCKSEGKEEEGMSIDNLTSRECEVISLIAEGYSDKQIACMLKISRNTIAVHTRSIYKKLRVNNRTHAVALVLKQAKTCAS